MQYGLARTVKLCQNCTTGSIFSSLETIYTYIGDQGASTVPFRIITNLGQISLRCPYLA